LQDKPFFLHDYFSKTFLQDRCKIGYLARYYLARNDGNLARDGILQERTANLARNTILQEITVDLARLCFLATKKFARFCKKSFISLARHILARFQYICARYRKKTTSKILFNLASWFLLGFCIQQKILGT